MCDGPMRSSEPPDENSETMAHHTIELGFFEPLLANYLPVMVSLSSRKGAKVSENQKHVNFHHYSKLFYKFS